MNEHDLIEEGRAVATVYGYKEEEMSSFAQGYFLGFVHCNAGGEMIEIRKKIIELAKKYKQGVL